MARYWARKRCLPRLSGPTKGEFDGRERERVVQVGG
jgi:hypothetical protein